MGKEVLLFLGKRRGSGGLRRKRGGEGEVGKELEGEVSRYEVEVGKEVLLFLGKRRGSGGLRRKRGGKGKWERNWKGKCRAVKGKWERKSSCS